MSHALQKEEKDSGFPEPTDQEGLIFFRIFRICGQNVFESMIETTLNLLERFQQNPWNTDTMAATF